MQQNYFINYQNGPTLTGIEDVGGIPMQSAFTGSGVKKGYIQTTIKILNTDSIGSTYLLAKDLFSNSIISKFEIESDPGAPANMQFGLWDPDNGTILSGACFSVWNLSSGASKNNPLDGLSNLSHDATLVPIYSFIGAGSLSGSKGRYDLVCQSNAVATFASGSGLVTARLEILPPG